MSNPNVQLPSVAEAPAPPAVETLVVPESATADREGMLTKLGHEAVGLVQLPDGSIATTAEEAQRQANGQDPSANKHY